MSERVLVTGASGYLGQAVAARLLRAGCSVSGLVRSDGAARTVRASGVIAVEGSLDDLSHVDLRSYDAIIDTATADHAPSVEVFLEAVKGTGKTYVRTSGTGVYTDLAGGAPSSVVHRERDTFAPAPVIAQRVRTDESVIAAAAEGIRTIVVRPSMVYGDGGSEQLPHLIRTASRTGRSVYAGAGENIWGNVHLHDLAELYLLALHHAQAGAVYNVASDEMTMRDIASGIARLLGLGEAVSVSTEEAHSVLGERWVDVALASNSRVDSSAARSELFWQPRGPSLSWDLERGSYRRVWASKGDPHDHVTSTTESARAQM